MLILEEYGCAESMPTRLGNQILAELEGYSHTVRGCLEGASQNRTSKRWVSVTSDTPIAARIWTANGVTRAGEWTVKNVQCISIGCWTPGFDRPVGGIWVLRGIGNDELLDQAAQMVNDAINASIQSYVLRAEVQRF